MLSAPPDNSDALRAVRAEVPIAVEGASGAARLVIHAHDLSEFDEVGLIAALRAQSPLVDFRPLVDFTAPAQFNAHATSLIVFPDPLHHLAKAVETDGPVAGALSEIRTTAESVLSVLRARPAGLTLFIDDALFSDPAAVLDAIRKSGALDASSPNLDVVDRNVDPIARLVALAALRRDPATLALCEELEARAQPWRSTRSLRALRATSEDVEQAGQAWRALRMQPPQHEAEADFLREITALQERCAALLLERDALAAARAQSDETIETLTLRHRHATERETIALAKIETLHETISEKNKKLHAMSQKKKAIAEENELLKAELSARTAPRSGIGLGFLRRR